MSDNRNRNRGGPVAWAAAVTLALARCNPGAAMATDANDAPRDIVIHANELAAEIASTQRATPIAVRTMAIVQVAVFDAVQSITGRRRPWIATSAASPEASLPAAVAAATRTVLSSLVPAQESVIEADYASAIAALPEGMAKADGIAAGERAAMAVLASCSSDGADSPGSYQPRTTAGVYVPTTEPLLPDWGRRRPWLMAEGAQFRPAAPPEPDSDVWKRDLAEITAMGGRNSAQRTAEQTAIARFWETTSPSVYWPIVRDVAAARGGDVNEQALLLAQAGMAMDDALIAVFDAKYAYEFWRPVTAVRSAGDLPDWEPLIETPMHPEYPCAHCIVSSAVGTVLEAAIGDGTCPPLRSTSPTAGGVERRWRSPDEFVQEVSEARILAGVHYRNSTEVGREMGRRIGNLATQRFLEPRAERVKN